MAEVFFIGDTHFGQENILKFKDRDGNPLRPFESLTEMHVTLIDNWNSVVPISFDQVKEILHD